MPGTPGDWADPRAGFLASFDNDFGIEQLAPFPALAAWRQELASARAGKLSAALFTLGDSMTEGAGSTLYRNRWPDRLRRRLQASKPGSVGYLPASGGQSQGVTDGGWHGGDNPWTFTGGVTGNGNYGLGLHSATVPAAATATITWFGTEIGVWWTQTVDGPTAAAVTLDGAAATAIDGRNDPVVPSQSQLYNFGGAYGFHTLTITPNDGPLVLQGVTPFDSDVVALSFLGTVVAFDGSRSGANVAHWSGANNDWSAPLAQGGFAGRMGLVVVAFGVNDQLIGTTPVVFEDGLVTIAERIDARLTIDPGYLIVPMPGVGTAYAAAMRRAALRIGADRAAVYDIAALRPDRAWGTALSDDTIHPNDAGHAWLADVLAQALDPAPAVPLPSTPTRQVIDASTPTTARSSWTEAYTALTGGIGGFDTSGGGTTVGERRHRVWLDPGTYRATVTMQEDTGLGTVEVLIGRWAANTPTLTSCGTKANAAGSPTLVTTRLATAVTTDVAGWVPVVIRKTSASGAVRFVQLVLDKTA